MPNKPVSRRSLVESAKNGGAHGRRRRRLMALGSLLAITGGLVTVLFFAQPWRTCDYEDTSIGCSMLPHDAVVMGVACVVALIGIAVLIAGRMSPSRPRSDRPT
ncbi:hypothetical protein [Microbacterium arborescens]|uniref:hypothetical protein n=1 Tax=Microbacterium arborescens TaxID=33883 RepID=UPI001F080889|nr:hypothetical protein [Microbacterium arborescens]